jgi:uncharacterized protein (DUF983 family)
MVDEDDEEESEEDGEEIDDDDDETQACPECGERVYEDAERCPHCGNYISPESSSRKPLWIVVTAIVCVLLIWFVWVKW